MFLNRFNLDNAAGFAFHPDPVMVRALNNEIGYRLADSLLELNDACRGVVAVDEAAIRFRSAALRHARPIRPGVFLLYFECLAAARRDDPDALARLLQAMSAVPLQEPDPRATGFIMRNFGDASLPAEEWDRYRRALLAEPEASVAVDAVPARLFEAAAGLLGSARLAIDVADSALSGEIGILINEVVFARDRRTTAQGFGGATSFKAWGALLLNAGRHPSLVSMANGLVHEAAHALLLALSFGEPVVENDGSERYPSPLRTDRRPMDGIFHATFVSARMCYAMDRLLASKALDPAQREEAGRAAHAASRAFEAGHAVVEEHARPTAIGRQAMDGAVAYMLDRSR